MKPTDINSCLHSLIPRPSPHAREKKYTTESSVFFFAFRGWVQGYQVHVEADSNEKQ